MTVLVQTFTGNDGRMNEEQTRGKAWAFQQARESEGWELGMVEEARFYGAHSITVTMRAPEERGKVEPMHAIPILKVSRSENDQRWRWVLCGANGEPVSMCAEGDGFPDPEACLDNFNLGAGYTGGVSVPYRELRGEVAELQVAGEVTCTLWAWASSFVKAADNGQMGRRGLKVVLSL